MELFSYHIDQSLNNIEFKQRIQHDFELCGFSAELQKGLLFYIGAAHIIDLRSSKFLNPDAKVMDSIISECMNLYSSPTGNFENYHELSSENLSQELYTVNHILHNCLLSNKDDFNEKLKEGIGNNSFALGNLILDEELISSYKDSLFSLNEAHNLFEDMILRLGSALHTHGYDNENSWAAGVDYFILNTQTDPQGLFFLINSINTSLSPLYKALVKYPFLFCAYSDFFKRNHLISNILQMFLGGQEEAAKVLHTYHQMVFYNEHNSQIRKEWDFDGDEKDLILMAFLNGISIRKTKFRELSSTFHRLNTQYASLENKAYSEDEIFDYVLQSICSKYGIKYHTQIIWNNKGDLLQFLVILFAEASIISMLVDDIVSS